MYPSCLRKVYDTGPKMKHSHLRNAAKFYAALHSLAPCVAQDHNDQKSQLQLNMAMVYISIFKLKQQLGGKVPSFKCTMKKYL